MEGYLSRKRIMKRDGLTKIQLVCVCIYFFLTFFEPYLNGIIGDVTKYYIFVLALVLLNGHKLRLKYYQLSFIAWLAYKMLSLLWTTNTYIASIHFLSQIGMILLLYALTNPKFSYNDIEKIILTLWISSGLIGFLSVFYSHPYHGIFTARQVLLLFGQETDPNNQAAFLIVGIAISAYMLFEKKGKTLLSVGILLVNTYSMFITGSRGGLVTYAVIIVFLLLFSNRKKTFTNKVYQVLLFLAGMVAVYFVIKNYLPKEIYDRLFEFENYEGGSERSIIWKNMFQLLGEKLNFIFGAGWGATYGYNGIHAAVHNTYIAMLCDVGILGFALFFGPIVKALRYLQKKTIMPCLLLICGVVPSFFLDAINKRFFWNVIQILFIFYNYERYKVRAQRNNKEGIIDDN